MMSPLREKGISKQGYLTKAPFHGENNGTPGAKVLNKLVVILVFLLKYYREREATPIRKCICYMYMWLVCGAVKGVVFGQN